MKSVPKDFEKGFFGRVYRTQDKTDRAATMDLHLHKFVAATVSIVIDSVKTTVGWLLPLQSRVSLVVNSVNLLLYKKLLSLTVHCIISET